jgi:hypothetical protein
MPQCVPVALHDHGSSESYERSAIDATESPIPVDLNGSLAHRVSQGLKKLIVGRKRTFICLSSSQMAMFDNGPQSHKKLHAIDALSVPGDAPRPRFHQASFCDLHHPHPRRPSSPAQSTSRGARTRHAPRSSAAFVTTARARGPALYAGASVLPLLLCPLPRLRIIRLSIRRSPSL